MSRLYVLFFVAAAAAACSGTQPPSTPAETAEIPPPSPEARYTLTAFSEEGLVRIDGSESAPDVLEPEVRFGGFASRAPEGADVAFTFLRGDSTFLARLSADSARLQRLHGAEGDPVYTVAWAPDSQHLAFGYRTAMSGDVRISTSDGPADPGCSASTSVAHWPEASRLVTGDGSNRYIVSAQHCSTEATLDIRKMHHVTYAPGRSAMAYIYRDLVYDRASGQYVPDSSLYVSDLDGSNAEELFSSDYVPRHPSWSPDGSALAFDVRMDAAPHRRRVVIRETSGPFTYLLAPTDFPEADVVRPAWSPSGQHVAFDLVRDGAVSKAARTFGRTVILATDADATWGWIDDETVAYTTAGDSLRAVSIDGQVRFTLGPEWTLLAAHRTDGGAGAAP
jgi:hypothetical protein